MSTNERKYTAFQIIGNDLRFLENADRCAIDDAFQACEAMTEDEANDKLSALLGKLDYPTGDDFAALAVKSTRVAEK